MKRRIMLILVATLVVFILVILLLVIMLPSKRTDLNAVLQLFYSESYPNVQTWLGSPKKAYAQAWFYYPSNLSEDVVFSVDVEYYEGKETYLYKASADWMALIYYNPKTGDYGVFTGQLENYTMKTLHLVQLLPETWYRLRVDADFATLKFVSFSVEGPNVSRTVDLASYSLSIPSLLPVSRRALVYYVGAYKYGGLAGSNVVYVDDVEGGIELSSGDVVVLSDGFEKQTSILEQNYKTTDFLNLTNWIENVWYIERPTTADARLIVKAPVRSGAHALAIDTSPF